MTTTLRALAAWLCQPIGTRLVRWLLIADVAVVLLLTLWPNLEVPIPINRPDLIAHLAVFGSLSFVATLAGLFGPPFSMRNLILTSMAVVAFSGVDESLQAIPFIRRTSALDDFAANVLGVLLGSLLVWCWSRLLTPRR